MDKNEVMITTYDNPFNPITQEEEWYKYDMKAGHNTLGYLANMAKTSTTFGDEVNDEETLRAMKEIVTLEPMIYKLVDKDGNYVPVKDGESV